MTPRAIQILFVLLTAAVMSHGVDDFNIPQKYCGRHLAVARYLICDTYNEVLKESWESLTKPMNTDNDSENQNGTDNKLKTFLRALVAEELNQMENGEPVSFNSRKKRNSGGIADECCLQACSVYDLLNYC